MAFPQRKRTPSFSSSVLDSIYRSIDESDGLQSDLRGSINVNYENVSSSSSSSLSSPPSKKKDEKLTTLRRVIMEDKHWLYALSSSTTTNHSSSNSSDSSAFSSSSAESYREERRSRKLAGQGNRLGDVRQRTKGTLVLDSDRLPSKFKTVKILDELKEPKQPMSPGARLTSFLNFIFQSNARKVKLCSLGKTTDVKSSSSRSCFSRATYNTHNINSNHLKRPVRFYRRDSVHKDITRERNQIPELRKKKNVERVTSLKEEIKTKTHQTDLTLIARKIGLMDRDEEENDVWSYSSSDLFELDNHPIGMGRYVKELPVYETTDFKTNQKITRGLLL